MKIKPNTQIEKKTIFVFKNVKSLNRFSTDPTANTILMTNQSLSNLFKQL